MKRILFALAINAALVTAAHAQTSIADRPITDKPIAVQPGWQSRVISAGELTPTPEMWFYEQERKRWDDPEALVHAAAQQKAAERHERIAAMNWYGLSNSRPQASPDPVHGNYSPRWSSNGYMPSQWIGTAGGNTVILQADRGTSRY
jgi:hypothetical protein